jgi:hypothetical protein
MDGKLPDLEKKVRADEKALDEKINEIEETWKREKPENGDIAPS